jgi:L-fucose mutarotase
MLKGIDPILSPDLLSILRSMGHGDEIVIADANFPSASMAQRLIRLDGLTATAVADAGSRSCPSMISRRKRPGAWK